MNNIQECENLLSESLRLTPGGKFLHTLLKWLLSFDPQSGRFDRSLDIELENQDNSLHHYISCLYGHPLWAEGQNFARSLVESLERPGDSV